MVLKNILRRLLIKYQKIWAEFKYQGSLIEKKETVNNRHFVEQVFPWVEFIIRSSRHFEIVYFTFTGYINYINHYNKIIFEVAMCW